MKQKFIFVGVSLFLIFFPVFSFSAVVSLPQTGQVSCYDQSGAVVDCAGTGQDGESQMGVPWPEPRFQDNGDGTVTDYLTGLLWLKDGACLGNSNWAGALDRVAAFNVNPFDYNCQDYNSAGGNWRLPNINELRSLFHNGVPVSAEWLNTQGFVNLAMDSGMGDLIADGYYWSSTTTLNMPDTALIVGLGFFPDETSFEKEDMYFHFRTIAVQDFDPNAPARTIKTGQTISYYPGDDGEFQAGADLAFYRYLDNQDGTATDELTGLTWTLDVHTPGPVECNPGLIHSFFYNYPTFTAIDYINCLNNSSYLGYNDWRIANRSELLSQVNYGISNYIDAMFNEQSGDTFLTSTINTNPNSGLDGWYLGLGSGYFQLAPYGGGYVWPVRGGGVQNEINPIADSGASQTVHVGTLVTLSGSGSNDPDGNYPLTFNWEIISRPSGSISVLSNAQSSNPSFVPDTPGDYLISLFVIDSHGNMSPTHSVLVSTVNTPPVADAGPDQALIVIGSSVILDGSSSYDLDGDNLTYQWVILQKPLGSQALLSAAGAATPTFTADMQGDYVVQLSVNDGWASSPVDSVTVSFNNVQPVASAGGNQSVPVWSIVSLDGGASSDANGDSLSYSWSFVSKPLASMSTLSDLTIATPSFTADKAGDYIVSLVVNDGQINSNPHNVTITVTINENVVIQSMSGLIDTVNLVDTSLFKNKNLANSLTNKINAAISMVDKGDYQNAIDKLENDILGKTDGCALTGSPDKNDWLKECSSQDEVYSQILLVIDMLNQLL